MGFLADKKILITGVLSNRSIGYGVAKACQREGATLAFTYVNPDLKERVVKIAAEFGTVPVLPCDVTKDDDIAALFDSLRGEWPTRSGNKMTLAEVAQELRRRLTRLFLPDRDGRRPCNGGIDAFAHDPHWRGLVLFYEYFHGETGRGIGASHQTGWTSLVAPCLEDLGKQGD